MSRLKEIREEKGLMQKELEALAEISQGVLCGFETGEKKRATYSFLYKIANALGVEVDDLEIEVTHGMPKSNMQRIRLERDITRNEINELTDISIHTIKALEFGKRKSFQISTLQSIAEVLECEVEDFGIKVIKNVNEKIACMKVKTRILTHRPRMYQYVSDER